MNFLDLVCTGRLCLFSRLPLTEKSSQFVGYMNLPIVFWESVRIKVTNVLDKAASVCYKVQVVLSDRCQFWGSVLVQDFEYILPTGQVFLMAQGADTLKRCVVLSCRTVALPHWISVGLLLCRPNCSQRGWGHTTAASIQTQWCDATA